ncbi:gephyrin-like molybdotransferase Glp [Pseudorhodoferax sp. Leaf267]|uniref:molybdopterin molybdotransferase MoeA n=1 Tax=Pseudorhodoferax sp. Leaf267 TaxID=1736316 RepID=UPI0007019EEE|nr:gephyrin-like molybdotransferase Glp [Pseudorhodoferax sp. Leaf267]KQP21958.1 molybdenum cofactor biosynthesis protein MoaA [Pseudorhodoferax sp. Leaf267]
MTASTPKSLDDALAELLAYAAALPDVDTVSTFDADGRVLAADLRSELQVPPLDNSAMDGYAMRCADAAVDGAVLPVSQRIAAGSTGTPLASGTAARIFTGAPVPDGADAVVMQEDCELLDDGRIRVRRAPTPGLAIRRAGEDIAHGAVVLARGTRLSPAALGLAASIGSAELPVARRPRVALFSTGDELVMPGTVAPAQMRPGAIYNSNRYFLRSLLQRQGCEVQDLGVVPDQREATIAALREASARNDVILTSGGVSVGEEDHVKPAVQALGRLDLWQIAIKPGKPFAYGSLDGGRGACHFIGLPGNPVSSLVTFIVLVRPFLLKLQGASTLQPHVLNLPAHFDWPRADRRREFLRARRNERGGLDLFPNQGSGVLTSTVWGDGLVDTGPGQTIAQGDTVRFLPFAELFA